MKSPQIQNAEFISADDKQRYTDMQVLKSTAGYYIGTLYNDPAGYQVPGSRDTGYFQTLPEAQRVLESIEDGFYPTRLYP